MGLLFYLGIPTRLQAQMGFFNFSYNGPDSVAVGSGCSAALQGNIPNPVVTSTIGATIITSMFSPDSSHFQFTDTWSVGETAHVYWFVQDNMGHSHYFDFFIYFVDHTPPVFDLTGISDTLYFNSIVEVPAPPVIPITDNCGSFTQQYSHSPEPDTCQAGEFTRTWTATDEKGNTSVFTQRIIIAADVTPPTIVFAPQNGSSPCETLSTTYPAWLAAQMAAFTANDPSGIKSLTNNGPASFPPGCKVPLTVVFKATDNCNIMISTTAVFSTSDTQGPVITVEPKDTVAYCSPAGNHLNKLNEWINKHAYMQATDGCSPPLTYIMKINNVVKDSAAVVAAFWASFDNACGTQLIGTQLVNQVSAFVKVEFFVQDACGMGNQTFAGEATFAAVDTLPPVITGAGTTEECGGGNDQTALQNWINAKAGATVTDDCSAAFWTNFTYLTSTGQSGSGAFNFGPYPTVVANTCNWFVDVTFNASDECGNDAGKTHRFRITDNQAPVFSGLAPNITVHCPNPLPTMPAATITDNCDASIAITFTRKFQDTICNGSYNALTTWIATDDCGNTSTATQNIFVRDTTRPVFTLIPVGLLMRCDTFVLPGIPVQGININATDLCSPVTSITTATVSTQHPDPTNCQHYSYHYTRTFTATDQCGNTQTATQIISVIDNQPPIPGGVLDTTALCSGLIPFPAPLPTAFDICGGVVPAPEPLDTVIIPGGCAGEYTIKRVWRARDYCFNPVDFDQLIHVIDSVAPVLTNIPADITVECDAIPAPPATAGFNGADNCAPAVTIELQESEIRNPDPNNCDHWSNYILRREWTVSDDCGNERTYTQNIQIEDTTPPELIAPDDLSLVNDPGDCGTSIILPEPFSVMDICSAAGVVALVKDTLPITPLTPPYNGTIPVDTIVFHITPPNTLPGQPAISTVNLDIYIEKADADGLTEYFKVYGEDGTYIDKTNPTPGLCSAVPGVTNLTFSAAQFNLWAADGDITIILAPNGFFGGAINPTCDNSRVRVNLTYTYASPQVPLTLKYALDGGPFNSFPPPGPVFLDAGVHNLVYSATDCSNNVSTASMQITVTDIEPPVITPPAAITTYVSAGACVDTILLPFPAISENCKMSGHLKKSSPFAQIQFIDDPDFGNIPADVILSIPGVKPNAISSGAMRIKFRGDNGDPREFFDVFHNITPVISTNINTQGVECQDTILKSISVSAANLNLWAAGGNAVFIAKPNTIPGAGVPLDFDFINPCAPLPPNSTWDGSSRIQAELEYDYAIIDFTITRNSNNMIVATGAVEGTQTMVTDLSPGAYTIKYTTTDNSGLMGMTTFALNVLDTIRPKVMCKQSLFIQVNPSGFNDYVLQPSEIYVGSSDNCPGALNYAVSPSTFKCENAGTSSVVMLTATDAAGNTATCSTTVFVQMALPMPTADPVCEGDTLFLHANPPVPGNFSYSWSHPSTWTSIDPNPFIPNAQLGDQGTYTLKITGGTGCMASNSVTVNFANLTTPTFTVTGGNGTNFCQGQPVTLNAVLPPGNNISYLWYQTGSPNPILLGTTTINFLTLNNLTPGQYTYYVKVKIGDCFTSNSLAVTINVFARPVASVVDNFIQVCAGQPLAFSTNVTGVNYSWQGPLGWTSNLQHPLVTNSVTQSEAGFYTLTTSQNGCVSIPSATVEVVVKYTPPKPLITGTAHVCSGQDVTLTANVASAFQPLDYLWQSFPAAPVSTGSNNTLLIQNVTPANCGNWRVRASYDICPSEWSDEVNVCAENYPDVTAAANNPICQDSTLKLTATGTGGIVDWTWILPSGTFIYTQNPVLSPGIPGTYRVIGKTTYGCADTAAVLVVGSQAPKIDTIDIIAPVCENGQPANLIPTVSSFNGPFTYIWTHGPQTLILKDPTLTINPFGTGQAGPYTLIVKDTFGCPSAPETVFLSVQASVPMPQLVIQDDSVCVGEDAQLILNNSYPQSPTYYWIVPGDTITTSVPQLFLNDVTLAQGGAYSAYVQIGDCFSSNSLSQTLTVNPIPAAPDIVDIDPVCHGSPLQLGVNPVIPGTTYLWNGPSFSTSGPNPVIPNMTEAKEGKYFVRAVKAQCLSAPDSVFVFVMALPTNPLIYNLDNDEICLEPVNPNALIRVSQATQTVGAQYTWVNPASNDTLYGPSPDFTLNFIDLGPQDLTPGPHQFSVIAWLPDLAADSGCSSVASPPFTVQFDTIPFNQASCAQDHKACASSKVLLTATPPSGTLTGMWTQIPTPSVFITNPDSASASFSGVAGSTYQFLWSLSNGGCINFSSDTLTIMVAAAEKANAGKDTSICDDSNFMLNAVDGINTIGRWSQLNQFVTIVDSFEAQTPVTGMIPRNSYYFVWSLSDIGCGVSADTVRVDYYSSKPIITGQDYVCTGMNQTPLSAPMLAAFESGSWESKTGLLGFSPKKQPETVVTGLVPGPNEVYWIINNGVCGADSRDTFIVNYEIYPIARPDTIYVDFGSSITFDPRVNDQLPIPRPKAEVVVQAANGLAIDTLANGNLIYKPNSGFSGEDVFEYRICNNKCGDNACSTNFVVVYVGEAGVCYVPSIITPNNDGLNDFFQLPPECYLSGEGGLATVEVTIFNQWGDYVYHRISTQEPSGIISWDGRYNGSQLPAGTYYYIVKSEGDPNVKKGFLLIQY